MRIIPLPPCPINSGSGVQALLRRACREGMESVACLGGENLDYLEVLIDTSFGSLGNYW